MTISYKYKGGIILLSALLGVILFFLLIEFVSWFSLVCFFIVLLIFFGIDILFNVRFEKRHYFFVIFIAIIGFLLSFIQFRYPYTDKILHFIGAIMLSSLLYCMLGKKLSKKQTLVFVLFVTFGIIVFYEFFESLMDVFFNMRFQGVFLDTEGGRVVMGKHEDTFWDVFYGFLGGIVYFLSSFWKRNN